MVSTKDKNITTQKEISLEEEINIVKQRIKKEEGGKRSEIIYDFV